MAAPKKSYRALESFTRSSGYHAPITLEAGGPVPILERDPETGKVTKPGIPEEEIPELVARKLIAEVTAPAEKPVPEVADKKAPAPKKTDEAPA